MEDIEEMKKRKAQKYRLYQWRNVVYGAKSKLIVIEMGIIIAPYIYCKKDIRQICKVNFFENKLLMMILTTWFSQTVDGCHLIRF